MGARLNNNSPQRALGYVEDALRLDIRQLRKQRGLFVDGEVTGIALRNSGIFVETDLTSPTFPSLKVTFPGNQGGGPVQNIMLEARPTRFSGQRWYFLAKTGERAEVLYFSSGEFKFRKDARRKYKSQSMTG